MQSLVVPSGICKHFIIKTLKVQTFFEIFSLLNLSISHNDKINLVTFVSVSIKPGSFIDSRLMYFGIAFETTLKNFCKKIKKLFPDEVFCNGMLLKSVRTVQCLANRVCHAL